MNLSIFGSLVPHLHLTQSSCHKKSRLDRWPNCCPYVRTLGDGLTWGIRAELPHPLKLRPVRIRWLPTVNINFSDYLFWDQSRLQDWWSPKKRGQKKKYPTKVLDCAARPSPVPASRSPYPSSVAEEYRVQRSKSQLSRTVLQEPIKRFYFAKHYLNKLILKSWLWVSMLAKQQSLEKVIFSSLGFKQLFYFYQKTKAAANSHRFHASSYTE